MRALLLHLLAHIRRRPAAKIRLAIAISPATAPGTVVEEVSDAMTDRAGAAVAGVIAMERTRNALVARRTSHRTTGPLGTIGPTAAAAAGGTAIAAQESTVRAEVITGEREVEAVTTMGSAEELAMVEDIAAGDRMVFDFTFMI